MPRPCSFASVVAPTQRVEERHRVALGNHEQAVGLALAARELRDELRRGNADRAGEARARVHLVADAPGDFGGRAKQSHGAGDVEKRLVDREWFDEGRELAEDRHDGIGGLAVLVHVPRDDGGARRELERPRHWHRGVHTERPSLVARRRHDAAAARAANDDELPTEFGALEQLDRDEECVHVDVENRRGTVVARVAHLTRAELLPRHAPILANKLRV
jgi:hypothetical protein